MKAKVTVYDTPDGVAAQYKQLPAKGKIVGEKELELPDHYTKDDLLDVANATALELYRKSFFGSGGQSTIGIALYECEVLEGNESVAGGEVQSGKVYLTEREVRPSPAYPLAVRVDAVFLFTCVDRSNVIHVYYRPDRWARQFNSIGEMAAELAAEFPDKSISIYGYVEPHVCWRYVVEINGAVQHDDKLVIMRQWNQQLKKFQYSVAGEVYDKLDKALEAAKAAVKKLINYSGVEFTAQWCGDIKVRLEKVIFNR